MAQELMNENSIHTHTHTHTYTGIQQRSKEAFQIGGDKQVGRKRSWDH